jgi:hypothetical protein
VFALFLCIFRKYPRAQKAKSFEIRAIKAEKAAFYTVCKLSLNA